MDVSQVRFILTQDLSSARVHERIEQTQDNGNIRYLVDERCQTDQSGHWVELSDPIIDALEFRIAGLEDDDYCKFCFPRED